MSGFSDRDVLSKPVIPRPLSAIYNDKIDHLLTILTNEDVGNTKQRKPTGFAQNATTTVFTVFTIQECTPEFLNSSRYMLFFEVYKNCSFSSIILRHLRIYFR